MCEILEDVGVSREVLDDGSSSHRGHYPVGSKAD
jgi:hypothetical protein